METVSHRFDQALGLLTVAECGSFTRAAERLGVSKAYISKQVSELEAALGVRLLHRTTRRIALTDAGRLYLDYARQARDLLGDGERAVSAVRTEVDGLLRITAPTSLGDSFLVDLLADFRARHPLVRFDVERSIAQGDLRIAVAGKGELPDAFRSMLANLREIVGQIGDTSADLASAAAEIFAASQEQESAAASQSSAMIEISRTMDSLSDSAAHVSEAVQGVLGNAERTLKTSSGLSGLCLGAPQSMPRSRQLCLLDTVAEARRFTPRLSRVFNAQRKSHRQACKRLSSPNRIQT